MLGSIKFLAWSIKLKTSYGILSSLKLTTLYLICNCQISSISVLFLYFKLSCCLGISVVFYNLLDCFSTWGIYISFFKCFQVYSEKKGFSNKYCHTRDIPLSEKLAKQRLVKVILVKIEVAFFIAFKPDYSFFL